MRETDFGPLMWRFNLLCVYFSKKEQVLRCFPTQRTTTLDFMVVDATQVYLFVLLAMS